MSLMPACCRISGKEEEKKKSFLASVLLGIVMVGNEKCELLERCESRGKRGQPPLTSFALCRALLPTAVNISGVPDSTVALGA